MLYKQTNPESLLTPFRISDAQRRPPVSLKSAHKVGVLNENWCKTSLVSNLQVRLCDGNKQTLQDPMNTTLDHIDVLFNGNYMRLQLSQSQTLFGVGSDM